VAATRRLEVPLTVSLLELRQQAELLCRFLVSRGSGLRWTGSNTKPERKELTWTKCRVALRITAYETPRAKATAFRTRPAMLISSSCQVCLRGR
jgi:hypothetical protein